jgi:esterase/lipase superfamily enzyme
LEKAFKISGYPLAFHHRNRSATKPPFQTPSLMEKMNHSWQSPSLGKKATVTVYGTEGTPILVFPDAGRTRTEWEDHGLIKALDFQLKNGHNRIFCVDSIDKKSFLDADAPPRLRISRHRQFENFIVDEVLPYIRKTTNDLFVMAAGVGLGGYHAVNLLLKHPGQIQKAISIGGMFQIRTFMEDYFDDNVYYNNPMEYLPNLDNPALLEEIKSTDIRLVVTPDDPNLELNYMLSDILRSKAVEHIFDYWIETGDHPWEIYGDMLQRHVP